MRKESGLYAAILDRPDTLSPGNLRKNGQLKR
jgi:hypothetical protein